MSEPICKFNQSKANAINCSQFIFETSDVQQKTTHAATHCVGIVAKGAGELCVGGARTALGVGAVYFIKKGSDFSITLEPDSEYYYICFHGWHADELIERMALAAQGRVFFGGEGLLALWRDCFERCERGNLDLFSEAALLYTVASLAEPQRQKSDLTDRICEYANSHFGDPTLCLSDIASRFGYDAKYLSALFKSKKGITFTAYLRSVRVKHAAFLMEEGVESAKSVAVLCGFSDALYFSKIFKKEVGMTPSEYKKRANGARNE